MSALARAAPEGAVPHPPRSPDAGRDHRCCRSCRSILFGFAIRTDVEHVRLAIVDPAPDARRRWRCATASTATGIFRSSRSCRAIDDARSAVPARQRAGRRSSSSPASPTGSRRGLPARRADRHRRDRAEHRQRASRPTRTAVIQRVRTRADGGRAAGGAACGSSRPCACAFNPTRESSNLFVPGLMAFVLTIISALMTAISLTREKETGTMEALLVSPLRPVADHRRQGRCRIWPSASSASLRS